MGSHSHSELIETQRPGFSLEQPFYRDPAIFERETERLFTRQWLLVDHISRIPAPGDYILFEIAGESIIVIRSGEGVSAFFNVCRHRGSRICQHDSGNTQRFVCQYHAWAYDLGGDLVAWRHMPADFDAADYGLHRCRVRVSEGLIFVCLGDRAPESGARCDRSLSAPSRHRAQQNRPRGSVFDAGELEAHAGELPGVLPLHQ